MKSLTALPIYPALLIGAALALAGCGQTGPLYMPKPPARPAAAPAKPVTPIVAPTTDAAPAQTAAPASTSTPVPVQ